MNDKILITMAIQKLCPDAEFTFENNDLNTIQFVDASFKLSLIWITCG